MRPGPFTRALRAIFPSAARMAAQEVRCDARALVVALDAGIQAYRQERDELRAATQSTEPAPPPPAFPDRAWRQGQ